MLAEAWLQPGLPFSLLELARAQQEPWRRDALCAEYERDLFFPGRGADNTAAKAICARCLVRVECLDYALTDPDAFLAGIWGGTNAQERRKLRRAAA